MKQGTFLFISDSFFTKHDPNRNLMQNKEDGKDRPCFYAIQDKKNQDIFWCVPISSKVKKYEGIVQRKIERQVKQGRKSPVCNTIRFGMVLGHKKAFLIQNMFPVTAQYVSSVYLHDISRVPVALHWKTEKDIVKNAQQVLDLVFMGKASLVFSDIRKTYEDLCIELQAKDIDGVHYPKMNRTEKAKAPSAIQNDGKTTSLDSIIASADTRKSSQPSENKNKDMDDKGR